MYIYTMHLYVISDLGVYELESVNILRKYTSYFDLFLSYARANIVLVGSFWDVVRGQVSTYGLLAIPT